LIYDVINLLFRLSDKTVAGGYC